MKKTKNTAKISKSAKSTFVLKGKKGNLLKKGSKIKAEIKKLTIDLEKIKKDLGLTKPGTYKTEDGQPKLTIGTTKKYSEIDTHLLFKYMKSESMLKHFWGCVQGQLTCIKKYVPESRIGKWRKELDPINPWSWK